MCIDQFDGIDWKGEERERQMGQGKWEFDKIFIFNLRHAHLKSTLSLLHVIKQAIMLCYCA